MKTILVGYEERPLAGRVLERAAELAKLSGANIVITSVAPVTHGRGGAIDPADPPKRHRAELEEASAQLAALGIDSIKTVVGIGDPAHAILQAADDCGADLIVIGSHDGGAFSRVISGSPGDTIAHKAHADVLIVH
jgi:nucleotide-binding universal stress UspA family protein